uniref:Uncharacterized protein n=1 Tax=Rhizophora mucronata TaxID=61149 RepID=A0A2P2NZ55_RHIMU
MSMMPIFTYLGEHVWHQGLV